MKRERRTGAALVSIAAVAALALAACSSSKSGGSTGTSASSGAGTTAGTPTGTPIKIALLVSKSGVNSAGYVGAASVAPVWEKYVNASGGIAGHPIQLIVEDTKGDAAAAQAAAKDAVETRKAVAVVLADNATEDTVAPYLQSKNIPIVGGDGYSTNVWSKLPNVFTIGTTIPTTVDAGPITAKGLGDKSFGGMVCAETAVCTQVEAIYKPLAQRLGLTYTSQVAVSASAPNYTAECLALIQKHTDYIQVSVPSDEVVRIAQDCLQQGFTGQFGAMAVSFSQSKYEKVAGAHFAGMINGFPWWADAPAVANFRTQMAKYDSGFDYRNSDATLIWATLTVFQHAMASVTGDVTSQSVFDAYYALKNYTSDGLVPQPLTFTKGSAAPKVNCYWGYTYTAGDKNPKLLKVGTSGNGETGDLQSSCDPHGT